MRKQRQKRIRVVNRWIDKHGVVWLIQAHLFLWFWVTVKNRSCYWLLRPSMYDTLYDAIQAAARRFQVDNTKIEVKRLSD